MNDSKYWVAFHQVSGLGPATFAKLEARFGDLEAARHAPLSDLVTAGVPRKVAGETEHFRNENEADELIGELDQLGITTLHLRHPEYPSQLAETPAAPSVIYVKGELFSADEKAIAIVGSRDATPYGMEMTRRILRSCESGCNRSIKACKRDRHRGAPGGTGSRRPYYCDSRFRARPCVSTTKHSDDRKDHRKWRSIYRISSQSECANSALSAPKSGH